MFDIPTTEKPNIEDLKLSELTVAQFRQVFQECLDAPKIRAAAIEDQMDRLYRPNLPGRPVW